MNPPLLPDRAWLWLAATCYLAGFLLGVNALLRDRRQSRVLMYGLLVAGFVFQTCGLGARGQAAQGCPLTNFFEIMQFITWSSMVLFLFVGPAFRVSLLGFFTSGLSALLSLVSLLMSGWDSPDHHHYFGGNPWIEFHAALAVFSYGVFGLLALTSFMYLLQTHSLKSKRLHGLYAFLPSIFDLDQINLRLLLTGVVLLSASLAVGSVYWLHNSATVDTVKLVFTVAVWAAYLTALVLRARSLLITKALASTCIVLFAAALLSLEPINSSRHPVTPASAIRQP
jgi:ABC-type uncharacterized transport system permease subunit